MRIVGIDPGVMVTGYGIIEEEDKCLLPLSSGEIKTSPQHSFPKRLRKIYDHLHALIQEFRPDVMVLESIFLAKNFQVALKLGQARGMALLAAEMDGIPVEEYSPSEVKRAVVGYGAATKEQVQRMVGGILHLKEAPTSHHAADALSVAVCHAHSAKMREMIVRR
ncbi:MAG TPA: crossover junction endodeoxyribonuclease RuvC [Nitrospiria bacterium]|nr:crossover junction endodeoxyribonuclease RuvC [Nitrospiria bacterium]